MIKKVGFIIYTKHHRIRGVSTTPKMDSRFPRIKLDMSLEVKRAFSRKKETFLFRGCSVLSTSCREEKMSKISVCIRYM